MVKVVYMDGEYEYIENAKEFEHSEGHKMFIVSTGKNAILIPDANVRLIGCVKKENGVYVYE